MSQVRVTGFSGSSPTGGIISSHAHSNPSVDKSREPQERQGLDEAQAMRHPLLTMWECFSVYPNKGDQCSGHVLQRKHSGCLYHSDLCVVYDYMPGPLTCLLQYIVHLVLLVPGLTLHHVTWNVTPRRSC
ncbi:hypothetical protein PoB_004932100 [Plakobranchus ocellatus]|uniref:Uncharacterized protein n=1 Tax=Plakobranchus ocellatus TaxID=259542 RepID=A0AAV4BUT5_9GAST|nr:hypothetical protein PoB_004932100 [Plakobranchus ocellatus]